MPEFKTESERLFAEYLDGRRHEFVFEPEAAGPDFEVTHDGIAILCEVTESTGPRLSKGPFRTIRGKINKKVRQGVRTKGVKPYVMVMHYLDQQSHDLDEVIFPSAMFGDHRATFSEDGTVTFSFGSGGRLQIRRNTRLSAVSSLQIINPSWPHLLMRLASAWSALRSGGTGPNAKEMLEVSRRVETESVRDGTFTPDWRVVRLITFHNPHAPLPLPRNIFDGPYDVQWGLEGIEYKCFFRGEEGKGYDQLLADYRGS